MLFGINGTVTTSSTVIQSVTSATPIAIVAQTTNPVTGINFYGSADMALLTYKGEVSGDLKNALNAISAQGVSCPIIINALSLTATEEDVISAINALSTAEAITTYRPNLIIAPGLSNNLDVAMAMDAVATRLWATAIVDVPSETEVDAGLFAKNFGSKFVLLVGPTSIHLNGVDMPSSSAWAGLIACTDASNPFGWAESSSNYVVKGVSGTNRIVDYVDSQDCEARRLRNKGVNSIVMDVGWRSYGFETTDIEPTWQQLSRVRTFYHIIRDISVSLKSLRDRKMKRLHDAMEAVVNYANGLKGADVLLGFHVEFPMDVNTNATVAQGIFYLKIMAQDASDIRELNIELSFTDAYGAVALSILNG